MINQDKVKENMNFQLELVIILYIQREKKCRLKQVYREKKREKNSSWEKFIDYLSLIIKLFFVFSSVIIQRKIYKKTRKI